jgi:hypothetical protein
MGRSGSGHREQLLGLSHARMLNAFVDRERACERMVRQLALMVAKSAWPQSSGA